jgi:hypothetical protein
MQGQVRQPRELTCSSSSSSSNGISSQNQHMEACVV